MSLVGNLLGIRLRNGESTLLARFIIPAVQAGSPAKEVLEGGRPLAGGEPGAALGPEKWVFSLAILEALPLISVASDLFYWSGSEMRSG